MFEKTGQATAAFSGHDDLKSDGFNVAKDSMEARDSISEESDDAALARLGYKSEMLREFGNLSTFSFAFSIMGMCSSIATTFNTPLALGGPSSVVWCWFMGSILNISLGASIAEIVSAYPTSGGLYTASAQLVPRKHRALVGWITGWLNMLGQVAGVASTEFGLAQMIWAAVSVARDGDFEVTAGMQFGLFAGLMIVHGFLNSVPTKHLAFMTQGFVFINIGTTFIIIIVLLATTGTSNMQPASYVFTNVNNQSGWESNGLAWLFGLLSVQWTMTDYDAAAHISEEVKKAAVAAPVAIFVAVVGTGMIGWLLNVVLVLCMGDIGDLPGPSGSAFLSIMNLRMGKVGALILWVPVMSVAFFTVQTALQANSRTFYAFSRDGGLPDRGLFGKLNKTTHTPINAVWLVVFIAILMGVLNFASYIAVSAIFSMTAVALDLSYVIPVVCRRWFENHPEVNFKPGPFYMRGWGKWVNLIMVVWTAFEVVILCFPSYKPITAQTFNYAAPITVGVMLLSGLWYLLHAHRFYSGPRSNLGETHERYTDNNVLAEVTETSTPNKSNEDIVEKKEL